MDHEWIKEHSRELYFALLVFMPVAWFLWNKMKTEKSRFKVRESEVKRNFSGDDSLAQAKMFEKLGLPGFRFDGLPHEILGINRDATPDQINQAYKNLMKRFHPDTVGTAGSPEWDQAQKIAAAINQAREEMLK